MAEHASWYVSDDDLHAHFRINIQAYERARNGERVTESMMVDALGVRITVVLESIPSAASAIA